MSDPVVTLEVDERGIATIALNRPRVRNAYNGDLISELSRAVAQANEDVQVRVIVLRGNGSHFQAGADLKWLDEIGQLDAPANVAVSRRTAEAIRGLTESCKPTIALVHGGCYGGGIGMVAACDMALASAETRFAITEARWGVMAGIIVPHVNAAIGVRNARRYALSCEVFDAHEAYRIGLVHGVCDEGALDAAAAAIINQLMLSAPQALAETKRRTLEEAGLILDDEKFEALAVEHAAKRQSDEAREGLASFAQKRKPAWYR